LIEIVLTAVGLFEKQWNRYVKTQKIISGKLGNNSISVIFLQNYRTIFSIQETGLRQGKMPVMGNRLT
jgi:hypothetical protein